MKTTLLKMITFVFIAMLSTGFSTADKKTNSNTVTYYYFAYATTGVNYEVYNKVWITPLKTITINTDSHYDISEAGIANQLRDYMKAEYNLKGVLGTEGKVYDVDTFSEAEATKYYRSTLARYKTNTKLYDFKYLPERR
ncbi:hypothetical protein FIA58_004070 [Flavobacterium jejuense]|uniref:DUF4136 domain-containing protein n=1 Tax=Flavobacterium jejuense TaxID=1544455 RepID=A0ABX0IMN3_9FLAO|nr:hypothetical protein [Flavobacterium jejuense]NHN24846.1 hypothetical protein [Flavobacterium jejuense]